jgi:hypothetical protein
MKTINIYYYEYKINIFKETAESLNIKENDKIINPNFFSMVLMPLDTANGIKLILNNLNENNTNNT